jgi:trk system potassium uptake protein TrkA
MRIVFVGAGEVAVMTARYLIDRGNNVVIIETDREKIDELSENLDCSFVYGDGSSPAILREVNPKETDVLFCITDDDRVNLIASLVGRSLGFRRVITSIQDPEFENICRELGLEGTIIPSRTISRYLADIVGGLDVLELSTVIKGDARFYTFVTRPEDAGAVGKLELPDNAKVICFYRDGRFSLADENTSIRKGDEVVILTHSDNLPALKERWEPKVAEANDVRR